MARTTSDADYPAFSIGPSPRLRYACELSRLKDRDRKSTAGAASLPRPTVVTRRRDVVSGRKLFNNFHVGRKSRASEYALKQIMAQQRGVRDTVRERGLESIHIVNALASIGSLTK